MLDCLGRMEDARLAILPSTLDRMSQNSRDQALEDSMKTIQKIPRKYRKPLLILATGYVLPNIIQAATFYLMFAG